MDRQNKINAFILMLEGLSNSVIQETYDVDTRYLGGLEDQIIDYIKINYPTIVFTKEELDELIKKVYQKKHYNLKKTIDSNIGVVKYKLEDPTESIDEIINEEINKYKTLFSSIKEGTNASYVGLVDECTQSIMALLIRKNNSISFAKRTEEVKEYIYKLVTDNFKEIMEDLGMRFSDDNIYDYDIGKAMVKVEEFS